MIDGFAPIALEPIQETQKGAPAADDGGAAGFAAMFFLILGMPQAGNNATPQEGDMSGGVGAVGMDAVAQPAGGDALSVSGSARKDLSAGLTEGLFPSLAAAAIANDAPVPVPMAAESALSGGNSAPALAESLTPMTPMTGGEQFVGADKNDERLGDDQTESAAVSDNSELQNKALTNTAFVDSRGSAGLNDAAILSREPTATVAPVKSYLKSAGVEQRVEQGTELSDAAAADGGPQVAPQHLVEGQTTVLDSSTNKAHVDTTGKNPGHAVAASVPAQGNEIDSAPPAGARFQLPKTAGDESAEGEAKLFAGVQTVEAPKPAHDAAQRSYEIAAQLHRPDIALEKLASTADSSPAPWRPTVERIVEELAGQIKLNRREAVIQLDPPELGKVRIDLRIEGEKLAAYIVTEAHESKALIENHLQELHQALRSQALDLVDVRVSQESWSGGSGDPMQGFQQQQPDGEPRGGRPFTGSADAVAAATAERSGSEESAREQGRVSMWA